MKKIFILLVGMVITGLAFSQTATSDSKPSGKIKLTNGQKIIVESNSDIEATLIMGMSLNSNSAVQNMLEVKNSTAANYTISNTLTKTKVNMNMMGEAYNYDSETKESNNAEMAKIFDSNLNNPVEIVIDNNTGLAVTEKQKTKKTETGESNPATDMLKMFSNNSDDAIVSSAFEPIPQGKSIGNSWADTTVAKDLKITRTYTLKSITDNEAIIQLDIISVAVNKLDFQEMEFEIKTETKTKGEIFTDINTGLVKKRTTIADITGSFQMMGQDMPITAKVNSTTLYK
jgi:hypothetical protein